MTYGAFRPLFLFLALTLTGCISSSDPLKDMAVEQRLVGTWIPTHIYVHNHKKKRTDENVEVVFNKDLSWNAIFEDTNMLEAFKKEIERRFKKEFLDSIDFKFAYNVNGNIINFVIYIKAADDPAQSMGFSVKYKFKNDALHMSFRRAGTSGIDPQFIKKMMDIPKEDLQALKKCTFVFERF